MTYQVLARKWRPQVFDAVVGQDPVTRTLRNALASAAWPRVSVHRPAGRRQTTTARLLAKALAGTARTGTEACGAGPPAWIRLGRVDRRDGDRRGVQHQRGRHPTLRENVKYSPARGRFKVYIVDEVHMLSGAAFNAFLKTLEEPPAHVVFILATTDPKKIPATVLSRCQRFDFRPIPPELLTASLTRILEEERVPFEPGALPLLIRAAEGSLRDALSLLDTAIAYGEGKLDEAGVARLLGSSSPVHVRGFVGALLAGDGAAALEAVDRAAGAGEDLGSLCREAVEMTRRLLVTKVAPGAPFVDRTRRAAELKAGRGACRRRAALRAPASSTRTPRCAVAPPPRSSSRSRRCVPAGARSRRRRGADRQARGGGGAARQMPPFRGSPMGPPRGLQETCSTRARLARAPPRGRSRFAGVSGTRARGSGHGRTVEVSPSSRPRPPTWRPPSPPCRRPPGSPRPPGLNTRGIGSSPTS